MSNITDSYSYYTIEQGEEYRAKVNLLANRLGVDHVVLDHNGYGHYDLIDFMTAILDKIDAVKK